MFAVPRFHADAATHKDVHVVDDLEDTLRERIHHFLALYVHANATFLAERLVAHNRSEVNVHLLAMCYHRGGHPNRAIAVLEGARAPENRYLLAICCFQKNKLVEAENALVGGANGYVGAASTNESIPNGAAGMYLMGRICRRANRRNHAIECFVRALEMDPTLWSAYEELCELRANVDAARFFGTATCFIDDSSGSSEENTAQQNEPASASNALKDLDFNDDQFRSPQTRNAELPATPQESSRPLFASGSQSATSPLTYRTPNLLSNTPAPSFGTPPRVGEAYNAPPNVRQKKKYRCPLVETDEKQRRNERLSFSSAVSPQTASSRSPLTDRLFLGNNSPPSRKHARRAHEGHPFLRQLLASFGAISHKLSLYMCQEALAVLERLPACHKSSGWAQHQFGRAYFEMADYNQAHDAFRLMYQKEPHRMTGLDIYSTTLWHLKKEVEISYLAQQVTEFDKLSPEAWCVAGNCFSLQKEHDTALAFFQRAIQLDPYFTYAYTLSGHEYISNEDFEKATKCFRHAIRMDPRLYLGWYGLGLIYHRQEKYQFAEYHFRRALDINPRSSMLHCFLGTVLFATRQYDEALDTFGVASELQPLNVYARFQRATVLETLHRFDEAMEEIKSVRNFAPRDVLVHFTMGNIAKKLGHLNEAMKCYTTALYFNPKDNYIIKSAIDKINEADLDDDDRL